ncbi:MAG: DUF4198 domain-containing protein [Acidobacteria bacterium]|nr:DUF4198 domain-containing protein [Acidobacteriota bacterium]
MKSKSILACALLLALAASAPAHDTWLLAHRTRVAPGASVTLDLTSGMAFPGLETAIKPERVERARFRLDGRVEDINRRLAGKHSLMFSTRLVSRGVAALWVELKPKSIELKPSDVEEYLEEIGASEDVRRAWTSGPKRWRELYTKHAKTYVRVGAAGVDRTSWAEAVGMKLEIVPEKDPTKLVAGDEFPVRVLRDGQPLANFPVGIVREGDKKGVNVKTDAGGRVSFRVERAGRYLLRGTELRASTQPAFDWESDFTTMTFEVRAR